MGLEWKSVVTYGEVEAVNKRATELRPYFYERNNHILVNELLLMIALKGSGRKSSVRKLPTSSIRYYLWKEREFRLWREKNPVFKFPNNYFPTLEKFEDNAIKAKIVWKQDKQLIKAKALKLKKINKL